MTREAIIIFNSDGNVRSLGDALEIARIKGRQRLGVKVRVIPWVMPDLYGDFVVEVEPLEETRSKRPIVGAKRFEE